MMNDVSLNHTRWNCKYHIVFAPKFRLKPIYGRYRRTIGEILRKLCENKRIEIVEANACADHIHMSIKLPPKVQRGADNGVFEREELPDDIREFSASALQVRQSSFLGHRLCCQHVGINEGTSIKYVREQEERDKITGQYSPVEQPVRAFTSSKK